MAGGQKSTWERGDGEPLVAYSHFVSYRNTPASDRSLRKLAISPRRAFHLSRKHRWVARAAAYDAWLLELGDATAKHAVLSHRQRLARLSSTLLDKASESAMKLNPAKQSAAEIALLSKAGVQTGEQAFGPLNEAKAEGGTSINVGVNFGQGQRNPSWLEASEINAKVNEPKQVLVPIEEKVLERNQAASPRTGRARNNKLLPPPQPEIKRTGLREQVIKAPVRRDE